MAIAIVAADDDEGFMSTKMGMISTMTKTMANIVILIVIIVILVKGQCSLSVAALTTAFAVFQKTRPGVRMTVMVMILMLMRISTK